jgi:uncharacterized protein YjbJ (UPF0337 family)
MAGLVPAIHVLASRTQSVDGRDEAGHDNSVLFGREYDSAVAFAQRGTMRPSNPLILGGRCFVARPPITPEQNRPRRLHMDWNRVEGNWKQVKGQVKEKWGKLTDDDLTVINGRRDQLEGKIQERYGYAKDQAKKEIDDWYGSQSW